jgi:hypothetical protein
MSVEIEPRPQERILLMISHPPSNPDDNPAVIQSTQSFAAKMGGVFFLVADMRRVEMSFSDMVLSMSLLRELPGADQVQIVVIGGGDMLKLAADAAKQKQYGQHNVALVATPEEAFNHVANERKRLGV